LTYRDKVIYDRADDSLNLGAQEVAEMRKKGDIEEELRRIVEYLEEFETDSENAGLPEAGWELENPGIGVEWPGRERSGRIRHFIAEQARAAILKVQASISSHHARFVSTRIDPYVKYGTAPMGLASEEQLFADRLAMWLNAWMGYRDGLVAKPLPDEDWKVRMIVANLAVNVLDWTLNPDGKSQLDLEPAVLMSGTGVQDTAPDEETPEMDMPVQ
jgi:hypothetical protein